MSTHIVWDWNGTLLDDFHIVVEAVNVSLSSFGVGHIDAERYRQHFTRPVKLFYDRLFERELTVEEWHRLDSLYLGVYFQLNEQAGLTGDAVSAVERAALLAAGQSLLSMAPHDRLRPWVERLGLAGHFTHIRGSTGPPGGSKVPELESHRVDVGVDPADVVLIGDTPDDAAAAHAVGARVVLYDGGSHHRNDLEAVGVPVARSLLHAVDLALSRHAVDDAR